MEGSAMVRTWRGHESLVSSMEFDSSGTLVATGGLLTAKVRIPLSYPLSLPQTFFFRCGMPIKVSAHTTLRDTRGLLEL